LEVNQFMKTHSQVWLRTLGIGFPECLQGNTKRGLVVGHMFGCSRMDIRFTHSANNGCPPPAEFAPRLPGICCCISIPRPDWRQALAPMIADLTAGV
jgi:hypothetical protein